MHGNAGRKRPDLALRNKGEKQIKALKLALTGRKKTPEHRLALSEACNGRIISEETRLKISKSSRGRKLSLETRRRQSLGKRGAQCWNWKGGTRTENELIKASSEYRIWRETVFKRDDYVCQACGKRGGKLQTDHELPFAFYPDLRFELLNGRTLCIPCHRKTPTWGNNFNVYA